MNLGPTRLIGRQSVKLRDIRGQKLLISAAANCERCGRPLKTNESRLRGFGTTCWKKKSQK